MGFMLGNLMPEQIAERLNIKFSEEHIKLMNETHQSKVNNTPLESGKWHCYDLPFNFVCSDRETAEKWSEIFKSYDANKFAEQIGISWEK